MGVRHVEVGEGVRVVAGGHAACAQELGGRRTSSRWWTERAPPDGWRHRRNATREAQSTAEKCRYSTIAALQVEAHCGEKAEAEGEQSGASGEGCKLTLGRRQAPGRDESHSLHSGCARQRAHHLQPVTGIKPSAPRRSPAANERATVASCGLGWICAARSYRKAPERADVRGATVRGTRDRITESTEMRCCSCVCCRMCCAAAWSSYSRALTLLPCESWHRDYASAPSASSAQRREPAVVAAPVAARGNPPYQLHKHGQHRDSSVRGVACVRRAAYRPSHFADSRTNRHGQRAHGGTHQAEGSRPRAQNRLSAAGVTQPAQKSRKALVSAGLCTATRSVGWQPIPPLTARPAAEA